MPDFSDAFNPFLIYQISSIVAPTELHAQLRKHSGSRTAASLLISALRSLEDEVRRLEESHDIYSSTITNALEVLGAVQSELNLHREAAASYRRIVHYNDILEYQSSSLFTTDWKKAEEFMYLRPRRNLEALFNLGVQLNKCCDHIAAEVALRRLIPRVRASHGENSFQYRNSIEQLMYALKGQGCEEGVNELWQEYCRSQDDEISEMFAMQFYDSSHTGLYIVSDDAHTQDIPRNDVYNIQNPDVVL